MLCSAMVIQVHSPSASITYGVLFPTEPVLSTAGLDNFLRFSHSLPTALGDIIRLELGL